MLKREQIEASIEAIEAQRPLLGNAVVETTLDALRKKLLALTAETETNSLELPAQRKQVTILFARISGFSRVAEALQDTNTLDLMNRLWRRLDEAITNQGGTVDKHVGDGVMGVFGVPQVQEDDPERAIRAALAMRAALGDFVGQVTQGIQLGANGRSDPLLDRLQDLEMRIGINSGPVLFGEMGTSDEYTVIGDAVNVASRVTDASPSGGILISHDTHLLTRGTFDIEPLGPVSVKGKSEPIPVYLVLGANPRLFFQVGRGVEGVETHMVGRDAELQRLQAGLEQTTQKRQGEAILIAGEAGVGKSRLIYEFNNWIRQRHSKTAVLKGRTDQQMGSLPYGLIRDVVTSHFGIQDNDPTAVAEQKLTTGMQQVQQRQHKLSAEELGLRVQMIGQLIGLGLGETAVVTDTTQLREQVFGYFLDYFTAAAAQAGSAVLFFEDIHWADSGSLNLIQHLAKAVHDLPILVVCMSRPSLFEREPSWRDGSFLAATLLLDPLPEEQSRRLVVDILRKLPEIPTDLADLIVETAEGNPYYVEELVKILIEDGVIVTGADKWQLQQARFRELRLPPTLTGVLQARLDRLSAPERITLQRAAVIGRVFWNDAVIGMNRAAHHPFTTEETLVALQVLSRREMIFQRKASVFAGTDAYVFKHAMLRQVAYDSVLMRDRPLYHRQVGDWLVQQSGERVAEYAASIATHYEQAGEETQAAEMYEQAAMRAVDTLDLPRAIEHYQKVLTLLTDKPQFLEWHLRVQERLGGLLHRQARLTEAEESFVAMQELAKTDGDLTKEAQAWNALAALYEQQTDYEAMLEAASKAEDVAWLIGSDVEVTTALLHRATAVYHQGDRETAVIIAERALETSEKLEGSSLRMAALALLGKFHLYQGQAESYLAQMMTLIEQLEQQENPSLSTAFAWLTVGQLYHQLEKQTRATRWLQRALTLYRRFEDQDGISATLLALADAVLANEDGETAVSYYGDALETAQANGNQLLRLHICQGLATALTQVGSFRAAEKELYQIITTVEAHTVTGSWKRLPELYRTLASVYLGQAKISEALLAGQRAHRLAQEARDIRHQGAVWQTLGEIAILSPTGRSTILIDGTTYRARTCFSKGWQLLQQAQQGANRTKISLLNAWAAYEQAQGDANQAKTLSQEAQTLRQALG